MAENGQTKPWAPVGVAAARGEESVASQAKELRRKKRIKCCMYILVLIVVEIIVFAILGVTVFKIKSPKITINTITINSNGLNTSSSRFKMVLNTELFIKNKNMGVYKYENSTMTLSYNGKPVGEGLIPKGKAKMKRTRKMNVTVEVTADESNHPNLKTDLSSGTLKLTGHTKLKGKVTLLYMMKRKKSGEMNCTITIQTTKNVGIKDITC